MTTAAARRTPIAQPTAATPCAADPALFDSVDVIDHQNARRLCETCPALDWCMTQLAQAAASTLTFGHGPRGTWAGTLVVGRQRSRPPQRAAEVCGASP